MEALVQKLYMALRAAEISLLGDEDYQKFKPVLKTIREALDLVEKGGKHGTRS